QKERDELASKLANVTLQRDDALAQVSKFKDAKKQIDKLVAENAGLMTKLADAEKSIVTFKAEGELKDREIAALRKEVTSVKTELAAAKRESADYQRQMADMQAK